MAAVPDRKLRIFVPGPHWFIRPHNTDWRYTQMLCGLGDFDKNLEMVPERSWGQALETNCRLILHAIAWRANLQLPDSLGYSLAQYRSLSKRELMSVRPDAILAYERYPRRSRVPVLWITGPVPEHFFHWKGMESSVKRIIKWRRECAGEASQVICSSEFAKRAFCAQTGVAAEKVRVVPFFLPHISGGGQPKSAAPATSNIRCLFVGRESIRKGLPKALRIHKLAPYWSFHVISNFADGPVALPPGVTHQESASREEVLEWMAKSDLLFSLSEYDSFGFAAVEAASRQCVPVFRAGSIQHSMFSDRAAVFLKDEWSPEACIEAIENKMFFKRQLTRDSLLSEFRANFSPEKVAETIHSLALTAIQRGHRNPARHRGSSPLRATYSDSIP